MPYTGTLHKDQAFPNGRRSIRGHFTHDGGGREVYKRRKCPAAFDADQWLIDFAATLDTRMAALELDKVLSDIRKGADAETIPIVLITRGNVRREMAKRVLNAMNRINTDPKALKIIESLAPQVFLRTNVQIASHLPAWSPAEVGAARTKANALLSTVDDTDHGKGEIE